MQNSAISFSICVDNDKYKVPLLINDLKVFFKTSYNEHLSLYTIRNYKNVDLAKFLNNKQVLLEQKSRNTMQVIAFG